MMRASAGLLLMAVALIAFARPLAASGGPPAVLASIKPLHGLAAAILGEAGEPALLIAGAASPHVYQLRPGDAERLAGADLVLIVGKDYELFLRRALGALAPRAVHLELASAEGVRLLGPREGHGPQGRAATDPHVWLDPANARAMARAIAAALAGLDPSRDHLYAANLAALDARLVALDAEIRTLLEPLRERPFLVFHDAYRYFETAYGLAGLGAITLDPQRQPGVRRMEALRSLIREKDVACVFIEPQFEPRAARVLVEGTPARIGVLDPLGAEVPQGPGAYEAVLRGLAGGFAACLGPEAP